MVFGDPIRALARFDDDKSPADCILIGSTDLGEAAVDTFNSLSSNPKTVSVPSVLLLDEDHSDLEGRVMLSSHRLLVKMPLKVKELREKILQVLGKAS